MPYGPWPGVESNPPIESVAAGVGINVDTGDAQNPIVSAKILTGVTGGVNTAVPANSTAFADFATPGVTAQDRVIVNVNNTMPVGIGIAGVWPTPGNDNIRVWFSNSTILPVTATGFGLSWLAFRA